MPLKNAIDHRDPFFLNFFFRSILIGAAEQGGAHWAFDKWCHLMCAWDSTEAAIALCTVVDYWYLAQKSSLSGFEILLKWAKRTSLEEIKRVISASALNEGSGRPVCAVQQYWCLMLFEGLCEKWWRGGNREKTIVPETKMITAVYRVILLLVLVIICLLGKLLSQPSIATKLGENEKISSLSGI